MKTIFKLIIGLVIFLVFATICLVVTAFVLINMTPNKLKVGDKEVINGKTCNTLGIGDVKIKTMISDFREIKDRNSVVYNPIKEEQAKAELIPTYTKLNVVDDGNINFEKIYTLGLDNSEKYYYEVSDSTIAYILNNSISYFQGEASTITNFNFEIAETTFNSQRKDMRVVYKVDISEFKKQLEKTIPSFVSRFIGMPKVVDLACYYSVDVTTDGILKLEYQNIYINDVDTPFANAILKAFSTDDFSLEEYGNQLGEAISTAISYLGRIGSAETDDDQNVISGTVNYGMSGYRTTSLCLICGD